VRGKKVNIMNPPATFVSIGAGNVASHLSIELCKKGYILKQVFSRSINSCKNLASKLFADSTICIENIIPSADFYLVSVPDCVLPAILSDLKVTDKLVIHTAGSVGMEIFQNRFKQYGILYPLQTFSKFRELTISKIPFFIEGCDAETTARIMEIAKSLSESDSHKRKLLHIAAVFASNFTNFMYVSANDLLKKEDIDFKLLYPLMEETLLKACSADPANGQTGPAIRGDSNTIQEHIKLLSSRPDLQKLYTFISSKIQEYFSVNDSKNIKNE
jgi:predicted short-subunit dehydrogenase-like oxidoreductase (DUF2520 family)